MKRVSSIVLLSPINAKDLELLNVLTLLILKNKIEFYSFTDSFSYWPFSIACLTIAATVSIFILHSLQYLDSSQSESLLDPLLELQPQQHKAMFSGVIILASLTICSQLAEDFLLTFIDVNSNPQ